MKGAVSAQKALQGFKTETRELLGVTVENSDFRQINDYFMKMNNKIKKLN